MTPCSIIHEGFRIPVRGGSIFFSQLLEPEPGLDQPKWASAVLFSNLIKAVTYPASGPLGITPFDPFVSQ